VDYFSRKRCRRRCWKNFNIYTKASALFSKENDETCSVDDKRGHAKDKTSML